MIGKFKHTFEQFKQHYTYFHVLFYPHVYQKYQNYITQTPLSNTLVYLEKKLYAFYMTQVLLDVIICREMLTSVLSALVKNPLKKIFMGKEKNN